MFEKTQKAAADLAAVVTEEATAAGATIKASVIPSIGNFFGAIAASATKVKDGIEDGSLFKAAEKSSGFNPDPIPTPEQNKAILGLRALGKSDAEIALMVGVSVRTVKMAVEG